MTVPQDAKDAKDTKDTKDTKDAKDATRKSTEARTDEGHVVKKENFKMPSFHALFKDKLPGHEKAKLMDDGSTKLSKRSSERAIRADVVEGYMRVYLKKQDKNLFFLGKSRYYVVVNAESPGMEIFTNDTKTTSIYILSLCKATLSYDPRDDSTITDNMFTMNVQAWTKRTTIHYRPQTRAILRAAKRGDDGVVGADIVRPGISLSSYQIADDGCMSNESDLEEEEVPRSSRASSGDDAAIHPTVETCAEELWAGFNLNKLNPFSPSSKTPPSARASDGALSPTVVSPPSELAKAKVKLQFPSILAPSTGEKTKFLISKSGNSPMALLNRAIHPRKSKLSSEATSDARPSMSPTLILLEDRNELMRQRNFDKVVLDQKTSGVAPIVPMQSFWAACRRRVWMMAASISHKGGGLVLSVLSGVLGFSIVCPIALAGFYAANVVYTTSYWHLLAMFLAVHTMALCGLAPGIGMLLVVLLGWNFAEEKDVRRKCLRAEALHMAAAEKSNYHNYPSIEFPSWVKFSDVERAEWLNKAIERGWPYIKVAMRNSMMSSLNPVLDSNKPTFISALSLINVDMGSSPPSFGGIKCIPLDDALPDGPVSEISWDAEVRFAAGDDQLAEIKVAHQLGAAARVRLKDLVVMGTMRITLRPMATVWPGFGGISVSFISHPRMEFSLTAAKINVTNVPFISDFLQTFLRDLIVNNMVWPKVLDMPFWDPELYPIDTSVAQASTTAADVRSPSSATSTTDDDPKEKVPATSVFGPGVVSLHVRNLVAMFDDPVDLYCIVSLVEANTEPTSPIKLHTMLHGTSAPQTTHKTEVRPLEEPTHTCTFDEKYEFYWAKPTRPNMYLEVWRHHKSLPDEVVCTSIIDVGALAVKRDHDLRIDLSWPSVAKPGQLYLRVCRRLFYCTKKAPTSAQGHRSTIEGLGSDVCVGMLQVTLHYSVELTQENVTAAAEIDPPAMHGVLTCENQSYTTALVKQQKSVVWNEQFSYFVYSVDTASLHVELFAQPRAGTATSLGNFTTSVLELRKRLPTSADVVKETLPLQNGIHPEYSHAVTMSFQWRHLMS
ncbi:hypothetical protein SPRG_02129 [Saprolegnia parasitica CBS 223.65]|uniref:SMP-LTD domain-containing protein n=1 Tax=Saprolegnia parasitica (strain CBS 223.65) TaxID=695850 RepID=A0A067CVN7_SAPPC|nr:hypothetical protein SPRG_02129 [Saprolegnia parasitica CBS 223.65]KDO33320.1 hypothetical protein SPRG_02129 [Saprolegnia parasitica CBS 223.65]|eukprot:XP_012196070.1 hypothetical protein SPRG_02129 [Saprolegnia parasitica CBS 223.65]